MPNGRGLRLDVTKAADIAAAIQQIVSECGRLDILVNNAGVNTLTHRVTIDQFPREEWDRILAVDLTGVYEMSKAAAAAMRCRKLAGSSTLLRLPDSYHCGFSVHLWRPRRGW